MKFYQDKNQLTEQLDPAEQKTLFVFAAENSANEIEYLISFANYHNINISGGIFPKVIYNGTAFNKGLIAGIYNSPVKSYLFDPSSKPEVNETLCSELRQNHKQAYMLLDGLSAHNAKLLQLFNHSIGKQVAFVGGGAGYSNFIQKPCVFDNSGIHQDMALIFPTDQSLTLHIENGWEPLGPVLISNKTSSNFFVEFNWRNAFEYYSYLIETTTGEKVDAGNFSGVASNYPFGIHSGNEQFIIRDPLKVNAHGHIATTINVNEHTMLNLMHGNPEKLIAATRNLLEKNLELLRQGDQLVVFHCVSREVCMGGMFKQELEILNHDIARYCKNPVVGAMSIGEIISGNHGNIIFQNKSIVSNIIQNA